MFSITGTTEGSDGFIHSWTTQPRSTQHTKSQMKKTQERRRRRKTKPNWVQQRMQNLFRQQSSLTCCLGEPWSRLFWPLAVGRPSLGTPSACKTRPFQTLAIRYDYATKSLWNKTPPDSRKKKLCIPLWDDAESLLWKARIAAQPWALSMVARHWH